jgi:hypothetical protein
MINLLLKILPLAFVFEIPIEIPHELSPLLDPHVHIAEPPSENPNNEPVLG